MFGKDGLVSMTKQSMHPLAKDPVRAGSSWTNHVELEVPMLGKVATNSTLTYEGLAQVDGKPLERIRVDSTTAINQQPGGNPLAQLSVKDQSDRGTLYFDNVAGCFSHSESVQVLTLQVSIAGQAIEQTVKTVRKALLTRVLVADAPAQQATKPLR